MGYRDLAINTFAGSWVLFLVSFLSFVLDHNAPLGYFFLVTGFVYVLASINFLLLQIEQNTSEKDKED